MRLLRQGAFDVSTDGQKVWVNTRGFCAARLCKLSMEVFPLAHTEGFLAHEMTGPGTWERFREAVKLHYGVVIPEDFIPDWASPLLSD